MAEAGLPPEVIEIPAEGAAARIATAARLARPDAPTAILAATDRMAYGVLKHLGEAGLVAGRDISVVGYDNLPHSALIHPGLTTMELAYEDTAHDLADFVLARIHGADPAGLQRLRQVEFVSRATLGPPPGA